MSLAASVSSRRIRVWCEELGHFALFFPPNALTRLLHSSALCAPVRWEVDGQAVGSGAAITTTFGAPGEYKVSCETQHHGIY